MWIYQENGIHKFNISPLDAIPVMIRGTRIDEIEVDAERDEEDNLLLQTEVLEWLNETPNAYTLWVTPDFIEVHIADESVASAFKLRWQGSYKDINVMAPEHSIVAASQWDYVRLADRREVVRLLDDSIEGAAEVVQRLAPGYDVEIRYDVLVVDDDRAMLTEMLCQRIMKADFIRGQDYAEKGFYRQFEKRRRDGSYKRARR
jgi:hypothetical protein